MNKHNSINVCIFLVCSVFLSACSSSVKSLYPAQSCDDLKTIFIDSHGWHTGIVFKIKDINHHLKKLKDDFVGAQYLEIGWGDRGFYQADEITAGLTLKALLWPTDSVLHVVGIHQHPKIAFHKSDLVEIQISAQGLENILQFIENSFELNEHGQYIDLQEGLYGWSQFYEAKGNYHLFYTCNNWIAEAVRESGFPISTYYSSTATNVLYQVSNYAEESLNCN